MTKVPLKPNLNDKGKMAQNEAESPQNPPKKKRKCITREDLEAICKLTARGMTETQSVAKLGIKDRVWFNWKNRHKKQFDDAFTRIKANRIDNLLENMEFHSSGDPERNIRSDWRCSAALLAFTAPEQFSAKNNEQTPQENKLVIVSSDIARACFEAFKAKELPPVDVKEITNG